MSDRPIDGAAEAARGRPPRTGVIPDDALKPHGGLTGTILYWKRSGATAAVASAAVSADSVVLPRGRRPAISPAFSQQLGFLRSEFSHGH